MPKYESLINSLLGVGFFALSLVLAFSSVSIGRGAFGRLFAAYNPYYEILAVTFMAVGGYFTFRAGQLTPRGTALKRSLVDQVKSVEENQ